MVDYLRSIVSGNKKRFVDTKYNLDLTYITPRVIAMAFPGSGISSLYRNNIETVSNFLSARHSTNYIVFNLSGKKYDHSLFNNKVLDYEWLDHHSPQLQLLFDLVNAMKKFSEEDKNNVLVVHCNAGKGRTGTIICCYLLFLGYFKEVEECLKFYSKKRFDEGDAVTQPGQVRYVKYFFEALKNKIHFPLRKKLFKIEMRNPPLREDNCEIKPFFEIIFDNLNNIAYSNRMPYLDQKKIWYDKNKFLLLSDIDFKIEIFGDITIKIYNQYILSDKSMGRISLNTAFLTKDQNELIYLIEQIDPDKLNKKEYVSKNFNIRLTFHNLCDCDNNLPIENICDECKIKLAEEIEIWKNIRKIIDVSI